MTSQNSRPATLERSLSAVSGWFALAICIALLLGGVATVIIGAVHGAEISGASLAGHIVAGILAILLASLLMAGFFTLQPNEARVLILFGHYRGTVRESGFHWANPFYARSRGAAPSRSGDSSEPGRPGIGSIPFGRITATLQGAGMSLSTKISLRAKNFATETLKVNDKRGNPVEIAAIVIWRVQDTAQAAFDVEDYEEYVEMQSETALRHCEPLRLRPRRGKRDHPAQRRGGSLPGAARRNSRSGWPKRA